VAAKSAGFRAVKIRIDRTDPGTSLQAVRATRAACGADFAIMADLNQWWRMAGDATPALDQPDVRRIAAELNVPDAPGLGAEINHPRRRPLRPHRLAA
jgi:D-galactarolactone cycloisomerase